jgi:soluble lytic murein transglycosylase-like protein
MPARFSRAVAAFLLCVGLGWPLSARQTDPTVTCDAAAATAAKRHGVPFDVLRTITRVETGRRVNGVFAPWPWALNAGGKGYWLPTREAALDKARAILATGRRNLDLGCFQINHRWHAQHFANVEDMLDPGLNADYAARYLRRHYARLGDWTAAAGAYHSRTKAHADRYLARYRKTYAALRPMVPPVPGAPSRPARRHPAALPDDPALLMPGNGRGRMGSLVPVALLTGRRAK